MKLLNDTYYTSKKIALEIIEQIADIIDEYDIILEPSSGEGSFTNILVSKYPNKQIISLDIELQTNVNIQQQDFLTYKTDHLIDKKILIIGNPPYSIKILNQFMKKICTISDTFAIILPKSFLKQSKINTIDEYYHLIKQIEIPPNSYYNGLNIYDINTVFLVYKKLDYKREKISKEVHNHKYKFVKHSEDYDIAIRRIGYNTSNMYIKNLSTSYNKNSHYFIKLSADTNKDEFIINYNKIKYKLEYNINNTVGPKSLSKTDLIDLLNTI